MFFQTHESNLDLLDQKLEPNCRNGPQLAVGLFDNQPIAQVDSSAID
jgi:hypothetical protein